MGKVGRRGRMEKEKQGVVGRGREGGSRSEFRRK